VFGPTSVDDESGQALHLTESMRQTLSFIVAAGPRGITADRALTELASGEASTTASARIRNQVSRLRKRIGPEMLPASSGEWRLALDPCSVDYFALLDSAAKDLPDRPSRLFMLLSGQPFADATPTPLAEEAKRTTLALRQALLLRACEQRPQLIDPQVLLAARSWVDQDPLNEDLISFITRCHIEVGEVAAARDLIARSLGTFSELLGDVTPRFATEFVAQLGKIRPARSGIGEPEAAPRSFLNLNEPPRVVGREAEEVQLAAWLEDPMARPLLLEGLSGAGKTALLGVAAHEASAQGQVVVSATAREFDTTPYATFRRALGSDLDQHLNETIPPAQTTTWAFALELLRSKTPDSVLILDDVQWLDSLSRQLLYFLLRSETPGVRILLSGRAAQSPDAWGAVRHRALSANSEVLMLRGLDEDGVYALVRDLRPDASISAQKRLAGQVHELSKGLPAIACPLICDADDQLMRAAASSPQAHSLAWFISNLSTDAKAVGQAAAVLAQPLTYPSLATLTQLDDSNLLAALEELTDRGVLQPDRVPGYLSFVHALIRDAFLHAAASETIDALHRRAALIIDDIHHRSLHQLHSMQRGEEGDVARALVASGDAYYASGSLAEAVWAYTSADELDAIDIPTQSLINWAGATDRLRIDATPTRQRAFDAAMAAGSLDLAVAAARSGLPEAEDADGDLARLRLLEEIDADLLTDRSAFEHSSTLARQLVLTGNAHSAHAWIDEAIAAAETDDDLDEVARTKWLASFSTTTPQQRLSQPDFYPEFAGADRNATIWLRAIDALAAGDVAQAQAVCAIDSRDPTPRSRPLDSWHHRLFASTIEAARGDFHQASELSDEAMQFGITYGIREATSAWIAQKFLRTWMTTGPEAFIAELGDSASVEVADSFLAQASIALALFRSGVVDDAKKMAAEIAADALEHHSFAGVAMLSVCARVLGPDADEARAIHDFLSPLAGSLLVIGGGFACLGPVDLALASVTAGDQRARHFDAAKRTVSKEDLAGWREATTLEIAAIDRTL